MSDQPAPTITPPIPQDVFLSDRRNRAFVMGNARTPHLRINGCTLLVVAVMALITVALLSANQYVLAFCPGAFGFLFLFALVNDTVKRVRLTIGGRLLIGQITSATGEWVERPTAAGRAINRTRYLVTLAYRVKTPDGVVEGKEVGTRLDLARLGLPKSGTPMVILYKNDSNYMLL